MRKVTFLWGSLALAYMMVIGMLAACTTPAILLDKDVLSAQPARECPKGFKNYAFPSSGKVRCEAADWHEIYEMPRRGIGP